MAALTAVRMAEHSAAMTVDKWAFHSVTQMAELTVLLTDCWMEDCSEYPLVVELVEL